MFVPAIRFRQPFFILQHLLPFIGTFEDVQGEVGAGVVVSSLCENPSLRGPLSHEWVSIALLFFFRFFSSSASSWSSLCLRLHQSRYVLSLSLSLSLSVLALDVSVHLSTSFARLRSNVFAKTKKTCIGLLWSRRPFSKTASLNLSYWITDDQHFSCSPRNLDASALRPVHMNVTLWC